MNLNDEERKKATQKMRSYIAQALSELADATASQSPLRSLERAQSVVVRASAIAAALDPSDVADILEIQA